MTLRDRLRDLHPFALPEHVRTYLNSLLIGRSEGACVDIDEGRIKGHASKAKDFLTSKGYYVKRNPEGQLTVTRPFLPPAHFRQRAETGLATLTDHMEAILPDKDSPDYDRNQMACWLRSEGLIVHDQEDRLHVSWGGHPEVEMMP